MGSHDIHKLTIPKWGLTMEEGTVGAWLVEEGTRVEPGTEVVEVETDKSTQAVEVSVSGILRRKLAAEGEIVPVGGAIAIIAETDVPDAEIDEFIARLRTAASEDFAATTTSAEGTQTMMPPQTGGTTARPVSRMRAAIAKTVTEGWTIPQFPVTMAIDMEQVEQLCRTLKEEGCKVSINDVVITSVATALKKHPGVHATLSGDSFIYHDDINVALVVGMEEGLMMPVLSGCQNLTLQQIGEKSHNLIEKVKSGLISEEDMVGGNFAISNLGMFGVESFAALVPPGQAAILAVGVIKDEALVRGGQIVAGRIMRVTLAADHRIIDGIASAAFLADLKQVLENPALLKN